MVITNVCSDYIRPIFPFLLSNKTFILQYFKLTLNHLLCFRDFRNAYIYIIRSVIDAIGKLDPLRKCYRLVGGVLVERTVEDVLPAVTKNYESVRRVLGLGLSCLVICVELFQCCFIIHTSSNTWP